MERNRKLSCDLDHWVCSQHDDLLHVLRACTSWREARGHDVWRHVLPQLFLMMQSEQLLGDPDCQRLLKDLVLKAAGQERVRFVDM